MKEEFNKDVITLTALDGHPVSVELRNIDCVRPGNPWREDRPTIIVLKKSDSRPESIEIAISESAQEVARIINAYVPSHILQNAAAGIIQERRDWARSSIREKQQEFENLKSSMDKRHEIEMRNARQIIESVRARIELAQRLLDTNGRLKFAQSLRRKALNMPEGGLRTIANRLAEKIGGQDLFYVAMLHHDRRDLQRLKDERSRLAHNYFKDRENHEQKYVREIERLNSLARDPQMREEDRRILEQKINRHRIGHAEPEFRFTREPETNEYRRTKEIAERRKEFENNPELSPDRKRFEDFAERERKSRLRRERERGFDRSR